MYYILIMYGYLIVYVNDCILLNYFKIYCVRLLNIYIGFG